jgi:hypothetical protein
LWGNAWQRLSTSGTTWQRLALWGNAWQRLSTSGTTWQCLALWGNAWQRGATRCHVSFIALAAFIANIAFISFRLLRWLRLLRTWPSKWDGRMASGRDGKSRPFTLDSRHRATNNSGMVIPGRVQNGVVLLEGGAALPEGAAVTITYPALLTGKQPVEKRRIQVPLVQCDQRGSVPLTGARIAEILDEEDASPRH